MGRRSSERSADATKTGVGLAVSAVFVLAILVGSSILMLLASMLSMAVALISPYVGMIVLAFVASIPRPLVIPTPGFHLALVAAILMGVILRLPIERPRIQRVSPVLLVLMAFLLYVSVHLVAGIMDARSGVWDFAIAREFSQLTVGLLVFVAAYIVLRGRSPYPVLTSLLASAFVASIVTIAQSMGSEGVFTNLIALSPGEFGEFAYRVVAYFGDPNYLGAFLATSTALAAACALLVRSRWQRITLVGLAILFSAALILTLSRGAILAVAAGLVVVAFMRSLRTGLATLAGGALLFIVGYPLFSALRFGESSGLAGASIGEQAESSGRLGTWLAGVELFQASPVFGIGFGRFAQESSTGLAAHNWYFQVLGELGLIGLALWALFIAAVVLALRGAHHSAQTVGYAVLASWMVASLFIELPAVYQSSALVFVAVAAALSADWGQPRVRRPEAAPASRKLLPARVTRAKPQHVRLGSE